MRDALHAEWTKLRSLASTYWLVVTSVVLTVGVSAVAVATSTYRPGDPLDTAKLSLTGIEIGQAILAVLAVLTISNEYRTGMMRITLTAMPRRLTVLAAKAAAVIGIAVVGGILAVAGSLLAGMVILPAHGFTITHGYSVLSLAHGATARAAFGSVLYLVLIVLLGIGVATAVRDSATAVGIMVGLLYIFPLLAQTVSDPIWHRYLDQIGPTTAGLAIQATTNLQDLPISPWAGLGVLSAWAAAALIAGGTTLCLRDA